MIEIHLDGERPYLLEQLTAMFPAWPALIAKVRQHVGPANKKEVWEEQAVAIAILAKQFNRRNALILELGANRGMTAAIMQLAAPRSSVTTLEPHQLRRKMTRANISSLGVSVRPEQSVAYLDVDDRSYDMIFDDGDHKNIRLDLPWYNRLRVGGLFLHHDFSPAGSSRECPPVFDTLTEFSRVLNHEPDVLVRDETGTGIAGWYRREGETWADAR